MVTSAVVEVAPVPVKNGGKLLAENFKLEWRSGVAVVVIGERMLILSASGRKNIGKKYFHFKFFDIGMHSELEIKVKYRMNSAVIIWNNLILCTTSNKFLYFRFIKKIMNEKYCFARLFLFSGNAEKC